MKRNVFYGIFIGLFLALCLIMSVGMAVEKPAMEEFPKLFDEDKNLNTQFLSQSASWVNENFALRQKLILLDNWISVNVYKTSPVSGGGSGGQAGAYGEVGGTGVILGKNGWLYYEPTIDDYTGIRPMTDRELFSAAKNLALMQEYTQGKGTKFLFVTAPNKNSLYGENMPYYGVVAKQRNADRLHDLLDGMGVAYVNLFETFGAQQETLYFAHDSHWNTKGAALGADVINKGFGVTTDYFGGDFSQTQPHAGDLYTMMYPGAQDSERDLVYGGQLEFSFTGVKKPDAPRLGTENGGGSGKLIAHRDSFGNLLFPYLAASYHTALFTRSTTYDLTQEADYVLVELVERNLSYLITNVPVMESPVRQLELTGAVGGTLQLEIPADAKVPAGCKQVRGRLPKAADTESSVYVVCDGVGYEAFCLADNGFAANVPEQKTAQYVIYTVGGNTLIYEVK